MGVETTLCTDYQILKDFAGPAATVVAAVVAVIVTSILGRGQQRIAKQQAKTARERFRFDLYEKRFSVYNAVLELYQADMKKELPEIEAAEFAFVSRFRESLFLFDIKDGVYDTLSAVKDAQSWISAHERDKLKIGSLANGQKNAEERIYSSNIAERASKSRSEFETLLHKLEVQLHKYLDFSNVNVR